MVDVNITIPTAVAQVGLYLGAGLSVSIAALSAGFAGRQTAAYAFDAIARQPATEGLLLRSSLISAAVSETGAIFCLVISMLLVFGGFIAEGIVLDYARGASFLAAGLAVGLGTFGPNLGSGYTGAESCVGIGRNPSHSMPQTTNMLISQAMAQTPAIYSLVVAILLLYTIPNVAEAHGVGNQIMKAFAYLGAAMSIGIGTFGAGIGSGYVTGKCSKMMGRYLEQKANWMRMTIITSAVAQTTAIYALVVSFLLIFL